MLHKRKEKMHMGQRVVHEYSNGNLLKESQKMIEVVHKSKVDLLMIFWR